MFASGRSSRWLVQECSLQGRLVAAGALGLVVCVLFFRPSYLLISENTDYPVSSDRTTNLSALNYYVQDGWRLPLFAVQNLCSPQGTNIVFADCVPLIAPLCRLLFLIYPHLFDYLKAWVVLCFVLQGVSFALLLQVVGHRGMLHAVFGALLVVSLPAFLCRYGHAAVTSHFLLILALALFLQTYTKGLPRSVIVWHMLLLSVALLISVILFAMVACLFVASLLQALAHRQVTLRRAAAVGCVVGLPVVALMYVGGYLPLRTIPPGHGWGVYSMNLLSPVVPQFCVPGLGFSGFVGPWEQYEGFNFLGYGLLFLCLVHSVVSPADLVRCFKRYWILALFSVFLIVFSASSRIYVGRTLLLEVPVPSFLEGLLSIFRCSGRFFWPVAYLIMAFLVSRTYRRFKPAVWLPMLSLCLLAQFVPNRMVHLEKNSNFPRIEEAERYDVWIHLIEQHHSIEIYPSYYNTARQDRFLIQQLVMIASRRNRPVNTTYSTRDFAGRSWQEERASIARGGFREGVLYVFSKQYFSSVELEELTGGARLFGEFDGVYVGSRDWPSLREQPQLQGSSGIRSTESAGEER
ncbi:MAG: DUF6311 domain-containing protein [Planctomycetota bacterium]